jgi:hypothetical protein
MELENSAKRIALNLDIQLIDLYSFNIEYSKSPSLIYQLDDSKIIYGKIELSKNKELTKLDLRMKLDWSDIDDEDSEGKEIYLALRNVILVRLLTNKIVNNSLLRESVYKEIGRNIIERLKNNNISKTEKRIILNYIKQLSEKTDKEIINAKWEKIVL